MKRILMIANDNERWGPARLPEMFSGSGLEVAAMCQANNPLQHSSFVSRHYPMDKLKSWRTFGAALKKVMSDWKPDLIMPCDELVVVMLHYFMKRPQIASRYFTSEQIAVLLRSLGHLKALDAMVLKQQTRLLAESLGVRFPKAEVVNSVDSAQRAAADFGYPVFVKASFSWGGEGTIECKDEKELASAFLRLAKRPSKFKCLLRKLLARDWYYASSAIEVQQAIPGESVMYSVAALDGKVLGGLFAKRASRSGATGPSTIVSIGSNQECADMAEKMIVGMNASGFLAFDFMQCAKSGSFYLLECNPRPNQIFHLSKWVGADLGQAMADGLNGQVIFVRKASGERVVPLFPQLWLRDEKSALATVKTLDIPRNDQKLFAFMLNLGEARGTSRRALLEALQ